MNTRKKEINVRVCAKSKWFVTPTALIILLVLISGCLEVEKDFIINPDGSGKMHVKAKISRFSFGESDLPDDIARHNVKTLIDKSEGIDAWENVKYSMDEEEIIYFSGTAYFKDLSEIKMHNMNMLSFAFVANENGHSIIKIKPKKEPDAEIIKVLTQEQIQAKAVKARRKMKRSKLMMLSALPQMRSVARFTLPGEIVSKSGFGLSNNGSVELIWDGQRIAESIDELIEDEDFWQDQVASGLDFFKDGPVYNAKTNQFFFGDSNSVEVKFKSGKKALFDYQAELQVAMKSYKKLLDEFKDNFENKLPAVKAGSIRNIEVGGVKIVWLGDRKNDLRPYNQDPGASLSVICEIDGGILGASAVSLKVITDSNNSLSFKEDRKNKSINTRLSKDKMSCLFEILTKLPSSEDRYIKEISGTLKYSTASKTELVDLGFSEILEESQGDRFDAKILRIYERNNRTFVNIRVKARREQIRTFKFYDSNSAEVSAKPAGSGWANDIITYTFSFEKALSVQGKIAVEIYGDYQEYELPFKIENIDFVGKQRDTTQ